MNIGYLHRDTLSLTRGESVQSWQIANYLRKKHRLYGTPYSQFRWVKPLYQGKKDVHAFFSKIDVLFVIVDGYVDWYHEKFTFLAKLYRVPVVWLLNAPIEECFAIEPLPKNYFWQKLTRSLAARCVDHAICVSTIMEKYAREQLGIRHTSVVSNGADVVRFKPAVKPPALLARKDLFRVMWSGNGEFSWQALDLVIKVARYFERRDPKIVFLLVTHQVWSQEKLPSNIMLLNAVPYATLPSYLAAADVCLCLYHDQPPVGFYRSPMKLFDYMAMAKPVIASKLGQIVEVIKSGKNGFLVANTVGAIAEKITFLKKNRTIAHRIGKQARATVARQHSWDGMTSEIERVLKQVVQNRV